MTFSRNSRFGYFYIIIIAIVVVGGIAAGLFVISKYLKPVQTTRATRDVAKLYEQLAQMQGDDRKPIVASIALPDTVSISVRGGNDREISAGSGFIVDKRGYVMTSRHVIAVDGADKIIVTLYDKRKYFAQRQGEDAETDLALLKIDAALDEALAWGDSDTAPIGETVLAVGDPIGVLSHTVTSGIISQKGRNGLGVIRPDLAAQFPYEDFIQTSAALSPGNSGGPLLDMNGHVIGVNTAILEKEQYGLAVPSNVAKFVAERLIRDGRVVRGFIGVQMRDIDYELAATVLGKPPEQLGPDAKAELLKALGLASAEGVYVTEVLGGPAFEAGIKKGDVIVSIGDKSGDKSTPDVPHMRYIVAALTPGEKVSVQIIRNKQPQTIMVTVGEQPSSAAHP